MSEWLLPTYAVVYQLASQLMLQLVHHLSMHIGTGISLFIGLPRVFVASHNLGIGVSLPAISTHIRVSQAKQKK